MADRIIAYVGRHGDTVLNDEDKYRGQKDIPLNDKGRQDAKDLAEFMSTKQIGQAWTSDLSRARDTAKEVLKSHGIMAIPVESLRPLDAGRFTGQKKSDHAEQMKYYHKNTSVRIPDGESIDDMNDRVRTPLFRAFRAGLRTGKPSFISAHSSVIHALGHILHDDHTHALVEPGGVVEVVFDGKKFEAKPIFKSKRDVKESAYAS
jgi:broad specificity phosphatase PhoE